MKILYTVNLKKYDEFLPIDSNLTQGWRCLYFTDDPSETPDGWECIPVDLDQYPTLSTVEVAKMFKIQSNVWLPEHECSIYTDPNRKILRPIDEFEKFVEDYCSGTDFLTHPHTRPAYADVYEEIRSCTWHKRDYLKNCHDKVDKQIQRYQEEGIPSYIGLAIENGILYRRNTSRVKRICAFWWEEFLRFGLGRDQIPLRIILHRLQDQLDIAPWPVVTHKKGIPSSSYFEYLPHKGANYKRCKK